MRIEGRRYRDEWLPNFYPARAIGPQSRLRLSRGGGTVVLTPEENAQLDEIFMEEALFAKLERSGHIVTRENAGRVFDQLGAWQGGVYAGPLLHIAVLTKRCNLNGAQRRARGAGLAEPHPPARPWCLVRKQISSRLPSGSSKKLA